MRITQKHLNLKGNFITKTIVTAAATIALTGTAFAQSGNWVYTGSTWKCITSNGDIIHDTITDDGYYVDHNGDWVENNLPHETLKERSADGKRVIAVSKSAHVLELWENAVLVKSYPCASGSVTGDKEREGDCKTPIGEFYVCLMNANSKFTKGIGVSYPMIEDAERGLQQGLITQAERDAIVSAIQQGKMPNWYTNLGGEIEIHGTDQQLGDATRGCIIVKEADIVDLYNRVRYGDTILIYA